MSITSVSPVYDLGTRADYLEFGVGAKKKNHQKTGTDRLAPGFYCDAPSIGRFIELGNRLAEQHSRKVKAHSYVLSFHPDDLDVNDPADLKRAGDLGFLLAKKMHPNSPAMVVVHDDGKGGCVHVHITILNHDTVTGRAPPDFRVHWQVKRANDALMQEEGMQVLAPAPMSAPGSYWATRRGDLEVFDQQLGDAITEAALDTSVVDMPTFRAACADRGVEVVLTGHEVKSDGYRGKKAGDTAMGITYKMRDEFAPDKQPRVRTRKASSLSPEYTADGLDRIFAKKHEMKEQRRGNYGPTRTATTTARRATADFGEVERLARPSRRNREESVGGREGLQRDNAERQPDAGGARASAAADAAADILRRHRERIAREDAEDAGQHSGRPPEAADRLRERPAAPSRIERAGRGGIRPRFDAESIGSDRGAGDDELEIG